MQVQSKPEISGLLDKLTANVLPARRGLEALAAVLRAHATLVRQRHPRLRVRLAAKDATWRAVDSSD